jgi:hypothetical protein
MPLSRTGSSYRRRNVLVPGGPFVIYAALVVIAAIVFVLNVFFPGAMMTVAAPVWNAGNAVSTAIGTVTAPFLNNATLVGERDRLALENLALNEENRTLRARIADQGGFLLGTGRVRAGVLARPPVSPYDTLGVSLPPGTGIALGSTAYGPGGVPLGTLEVISGSYGRVGLYSSGGRETEGWVGEKRIPITLVGRGGGAFSATLPRESGALMNDVVYVPGPGALPIGSIARIDSDPSAPRAIVHIAPYVNLFSLTWVELAL